MAKAALSRRDSTQNLGLTLSCWVVCLLVAVTPLGLITGSFLSHDVMPKVIVVCCGAACLLFLLPEWLSGISAARRWLLWLIGAQAMVLIAATALSSQPLLSIAGTTWRRFGILEQFAILVITVAAASCAVTVASFTRVLWRAVAVCAGVASIYGIAQYFGLDPFLERKLYAIDYLGGVVRPPATMGHAIYFAAYLAPVAVIAAWQVVEEISQVWRSLHAAVAALASLAILLSGSRGSLLGLVAGTVVFLFYKRPSRTVVAIGAAGLICVGAFVALAPAGANLRNRIQQWRGDPGSVRIGVWRQTPALIAANPLFGSGPETFGNAFRRAESAELSRAYPDFINETPHNIFVDAACEQGFSGLAVLLGLFAFTIAMTRSAGIRAAVAAAIVCGIFASFSIVSALFVWVLAGMAAAESAMERNPGKVSVWSRAAIPVGAMFVIAAGILAVQDASYARLRAAVDANDIATARRAELNATSFGIGLPGYELWSSQELAKLKDWPDASDAASLAEQRGEDQAGAAYQSSILRIVAADGSGAEGKALDAIRFAPNWYKPHLLHAQILQALGRNAEAGQEAQLCLTLGWKGK
jgi:hypothetical protein